MSTPSFNFKSILCQSPLQDPSDPFHPLSREPPKKPYRIVLTGGPCGGKSTALGTIKERLSALGCYNVVCIPENATPLLEAVGGYDPDWKHSDGHANLQCLFAKYQLDLEYAYQGIGSLKKCPTVYILDRGILDGKVFCTDEQWLRVKAFIGIERDAEIMKRYDMVLHMTSCAVDEISAKYYEYGPQCNNPARYHEPSEAVFCDRRCLEVYRGHPNHIQISNCESFDDKISFVIEYVLRRLGRDMQPTSLTPQLQPTNMAGDRIRVLVQRPPSWKTLLEKAENLKRPPELYLWRILYTHQLEEGAQETHSLRFRVNASVAEFDEMHERGLSKEEKVNEGRQETNRENGDKTRLSSPKKCSFSQVDEDFVIAASSAESCLFGVNERLSPMEPTKRPIYEFCVKSPSCRQGIIKPLDSKGFAQYVRVLMDKNKATPLPKLSKKQMCFITEDGNYYELLELTVPPFELPPPDKRDVLLLDMKSNAPLPLWLSLANVKDEVAQKTLGSGLGRHMTEDTALISSKRVKLF